MSTIDALATASAAGIRSPSIGDGLILEAPKLPPDLVALLKSVKPDLLRVLAAREAAQAALSALRPPIAPTSVGERRCVGLSASSPGAGATKRR